MKIYKYTMLFFCLMIIVCVSAQSKKGYKLVWQDNFRKSQLDTTAWTHEVSKPGWVNNELQHYTNGDNTQIKRGKLLITARYLNNEYSSSRLITRDKKIFSSGIVEVRAKLPEGKGTWPAIWMLGNNIDDVGWPACGELDIMEHVGRVPGLIHSSIHNTSGYGATPYSNQLTIDRPSDKFHIFAMEWTPEFIAFYVDGRQVYQYKPDNKNEENWPFNKPAYLILNVAIGGTWGGEVDNSIFPATMTVDYVRVYQKNEL